MHGPYMPIFINCNEFFGILYFIYIMSKYTRQQINNLITKTKYKRQLSNSPSSSLIPSPKSSPQPIDKSPKHKKQKKQVTDRYKEICTKYRQLLEEVKDRNHEYKLQQKQLARLRSDKQRDQKQIQRLRSMLGMIRKNDFAVQVNMDMQSASASWTTKFQNSTEIQVFSDGFSPKRSRSPQAMQVLMSRMSKTAKDSKYNKTMNGKLENEEEHCLMKNKESILSPSEGKNSQKNLYKVQNFVDDNKSSHKLSNSPYSKFRYTRKTSRYISNQ